jgi:hypothetical protein
MRFLKLWVYGLGFIALLVGVIGGLAVLISQWPIVGVTVTFLAFTAAIAWIESR